MPAKHSVRAFGPARLVLSFAVAVLVFLVVWIAVRAVGPAEASKQPTVVLPAPTSGASPASPPPSSASPSASRTSSKPVRVTTSPVPEKTRPTTKPARTTAPPARDDLAASLTVGASWEGGYVAGARVVNTGTAPRAWKLTVSHAGLSDLKLRGVWGATGSQQGSSITFSGGTLAPGASVSFGYQATKAGQGNARPSGCSVVGGTCAMS